METVKLSRGDRQKARRADRIEKGLCPVCGEPKGETKLCENHRLSQAESNRKYIRKVKAAKAVA